MSLTSHATEFYDQGGHINNTTTVAYVYTILFHFNIRWGLYNHKKGGNKGKKNKGKIIFM